MERIYRKKANRREKKYSDDPFHVINTIIILHISISFSAHSWTLLYAPFGYNLHGQFFWLLFRANLDACVEISKYTQIGGCVCTRERENGVCIGQLLVKHLQINRGYIFNVCAVRWQCLFMFFTLVNAIVGCVFFTTLFQCRFAFDMFAYIFFSSHRISFSTALFFTIII